MSRSIVQLAVAGSPRWKGTEKTQPLPVFQPAFLAAIAFVAANPDELFLLVGFFSDPEVSIRRVVAGQYLGSSTLVALSLAGSLLTRIMPLSYIRVLGLLPLLIGLKDIFYHYSGDEKPRPSSRGVLEVAALALSCGTDNIAVYIALFARREAGQVAVMAGVFAAMVGLWCVTAYWLVNHKRIGHIVKHWGPRFLPWILILLGLAILFGFDALS
jgi:cadmium resistance protein CadD (predicted permease)